MKRQAEMAENDILNGAFEELTELPESQGREKLHGRIQELRPIVDQANEKALAVLTPKQRDAIAKMKGKEIDFIKLVEQVGDLTADCSRKMPVPVKP